MSVSINVDAYMKEHAATLLRNSIDSLNMLRNLDIFYNADDQTQIANVIAAAMQLRDDLTRKHELPRWHDVWGQPRRWEHPSK